MFHANLQTYMKKTGKKPNDFYKNSNPRLNISKGYFYKILRGEKLPSFQVIRKLAIILGLPPERLMEPCHAEQIKHLKVLVWAIAAFCAWALSGFLYFIA